VHEVTGLLIEDTPLALGEALKKLTESSGLRSRLGGTARTYVLEHFTQEQFTMKIQKI
jgi:glycosyltransferase involved in cell wall biosynthesis